MEAAAKLPDLTIPVLELAARAVAEAAAETGACRRREVRE